MDKLDFSTILASSIHDIKNSLGLILTNLEDLLGNPANHIADPRQASLLQHEARRANANLNQLLIFYKLGQDQLCVNITANPLDEFLEEIIAENRSVCQALGLRIDHQCDTELMGFFDIELVRGVLEGAIGNARRYARTQIQLNAELMEGFLVIRVEDDGVGFPPSMLAQTDYRPQTLSSIVGTPGHTQLGLYFAAHLAQLHRQGDKCGSIRLVNGHLLPGGCFELWLP
ncbi:HAMP domain-containing histidine kinase [Caldichromatium japonicum]|uniref:HAMP domain-containing histidine kinase n=1 Tax=Caldichromatium japonicum TaxID=2699430 RepID=A0A6G7VG41_9GAMM|nr:HAMP domain-containing sensor histidine kinase [Caldichromatium japonicum]QIK38835.1 HAMP domain-containing histidine kinase [Caldichromatium japonicum]